MMPEDSSVLLDAVARMANRLRDIEARENPLGHDVIAPAYAAPIGTAHWDNVAQNFYINDDGTALGWVLVGGGIGVPHALLSATHPDTLAAAVLRGALIYGNATPAWARLVHPAAANCILRTPDVNDVSWSDWALVGTAGQTYTFPAVGGTCALGAGTLTVATINDATIAAHTHAITSTSNPGANARILSTSAAGYLSLVSLGIGAVPGTTGLVQVGTYSASSVIAGTAYYASASGAGPYSIMLSASNVDVQRGGFVFDRARGNVGALAIVQNGDSVGFFGFRGYDGAAFQLPALVEAFVDAVPGVGSVPARLSFITGTSSASRAERLTIKYTGLIGIGTTLPDRLFHVEYDLASTAALAYAARLSRIDSTAGAMAALDGVGLELELETATSGTNQVAAMIAAQWSVATAGASSSPLFRVSTYPANAIGPGYSGHWTWSGVDATARTVIPHGTGDVTEVATFLYAVSAVTAGDATGGTVTLEPGDSFELYDDGTDALTLAIAADGSVTVQRTAGADTWKVVLWGCWL